MTTVHSVDGALVAYTKGGADVVLALCTHARLRGEVVPLSEETSSAISAANSRLAASGYRTLAFAVRELEDGLPEHSEDIERDLTYVGILGLVDPPREEVRDAIAECHRAGIHVAMVTGDHALTARAIAADIGLLDTDRVVTGQELEVMSDDELAEQVRDIRVYARVNPEHKLRIVDALKRNGEVVAMTGDGVNDAPALKRADIGIAMGKVGTDVAREAADMVLSDDNFATIVHAVEQGRVVFDNLRKVILFLLSCNMSEVLVVFVTALLSPSAALLPLQLLWINLVTDGLPALALGVDPGDVRRDGPHSTQGRRVDPESTAEDPDPVAGRGDDGCLSRALLPGGASAPRHDAQHRPHDALHGPRAHTAPPLLQLPQRNRERLELALVREPLALGRTRRIHGAAVPGHLPAGSAVGVQDRRAEPGPLARGDSRQRRSHRDPRRGQAVHGGPQSRGVARDRLMTQHSPLPHEDLAAYAHELRGALTIIAGYTELLRRPLPAAERESALDGIERAIRRADTLCSDALAGRAPASAARAPEPISLAVLAEQVVADQRSATGRTIELTAEGSAMVLGDEDALARVLGNLIDNAAKYSLRNAPIEVRVAEEDVRVRSRGVRRGRGPRTGNPRRRTAARRRALRPAGS